MHNKPKKPKAVQVELIAREHDGKTHQTYEIMDEIIAAHHPHLADARIAIAWRKGLKPDVDDRLVLGKCKKSSDLDRELHGYDFVILLNFEKWNAAEFTREQMNALLDHELCHAAEAVDENGDQKRDALDRPVWRIRKHDVEEFREIVERHGLWKGDLEAFAAAALKGKRAPLFNGENNISRGVAEAVRDLCPKEGGGVSSVTLSATDQFGKPIGPTTTLTSETRKAINRKLKLA